MTETEQEPPIQVSGPAGLLAAVPSMLGFHPQNSLVLMCLAGDRRRIALVVRVDLPRGHDRAMAMQLTAHACSHADEVVLVSYQTSRRRPPLLDDALVELARAGVDVLDAIVVRAGRARPALNPAMERAHPGIALPEAEDRNVQTLTAAGAFAGRAVLTDRNQLRRSIAGPTGDRLRIAERAIDAAATRTCDIDALVEQALGQIDDGRLAVDVSARFAVACTDIATRDAVMARAVVELDRPWLPMLIACAAWTPDAMAPPVCSVLAVVAYRHGDGALAQVAVDRCLVVEPGHGLAHLMVAIMSAGLRPEELERIAVPGPDFDEMISRETDLGAGRIDPHALDSRPGKLLHLHREPPNPDRADDR